MQQISNPIITKNNIRILPGCTCIISAALKTGKSIFTPRNTIIGKSIAYVRPLDKTLCLQPIEVELKIISAVLKFTTHPTVKFTYGKEIAYFDARSKGLVQATNSKQTNIYMTELHPLPLFHNL